jgi:hypothetical protein
LADPTGIDGTGPDPWRERLSEFIDGELDAADREAVSAHLQTCAACREDLDALGRVVLRARALPASPPKADLWPGVARRIGGEPPVAARRRQFAFTLPQLVAAGLALMVLSGGLVWLARLGGPDADFPPVAANTAVPSPSTGSRIDDEAAEGFQRMFDTRREAIDEDTARVLDENLQAVDEAVRECRQALDADPQNAGLRAYLWHLQMVKLDLLRRAAAVVEGVR